MKTKTLIEKGTVEDMRGKKLTDRSIFRYGNYPLFRMKIRTVPEVREGIIEKQIDARLKKLDSMIHDSRTEWASWRAPNAGGMDASRRQMKREREELDQRAQDVLQETHEKLMKTDPKYRALDGEIQAHRLKKSKEISDAYRKAIAGKSLLRERRNPKNSSLLDGLRKAAAEGK